MNHNFSPKLYGGLEASQRELDVPMQGEIQNWSEGLLGAYLNWTIDKRFAMKIEYSFEKFNVRHALNPAPIPDTRTHLIPVSLSYFHESGFSAMLGATYVNQRLTGRGINHERNEFVSLDASIGYRLPKRYGILTINAKNLLNEGVEFHLNQRTNVVEETPRFALGRAINVELKLAF